MSTSWEDYGPRHCPVSCRHASQQTGSPAALHVKASAPCNYAIVTSPAATILLARHLSLTHTTFLGLYILYHLHSLSGGYRQDTWCRYVKRFFSCTLLRIPFGEFRLPCCAKTTESLETIPGSKPGRVIFFCFLFVVQRPFLPPAHTASANEK